MDQKNNPSFHPEKDTRFNEPIEDLPTVSLRRAHLSQSNDDEIEHKPTLLLPATPLPGTPWQNTSVPPTRPAERPVLPDTPRPTPSQPPQGPKRNNRLIILALALLCALVVISGVLIVPRLLSPNGTTGIDPLTQQTTVPPTPSPTPTPVFNPDEGAILPKNRIVAYYAIPGAEVTGPAFETSQNMLTKLKNQGAEFETLDPAHPVKLGIDLVVSIPDNFPGPNGNYSHHVDEQTIQAYIDFCKENNLLLFLDLNFGQSPIMEELNAFMPYLQKYDFVHVAIDPEWMFPRRDGIPGTNLSNVRAADINPIIKAVAEIPMKYHVPRKILIIHQYRPSGDSLKDPYNAGEAEIADKRNLRLDPRVDVVIHVDSVGGYPGDIEDKKEQYRDWVKKDMASFNNFSYGGFKIFQWIEAKTRLMTPKEILAMEPAPMVITYGN